MLSFWLAKTKVSLTRILLVSPELTDFTARLETFPSCTGSKGGEALEKSLVVGSRGTVRLQSHSPQRTAIFCLSHFCLPNLSKSIKGLGKRWRSKEKGPHCTNYHQCNLFIWCCELPKIFYIVSHLLVRNLKCLWCVSTDKEFFYSRSLPWTAATHVCCYTRS